MQRFYNRTQARQAANSEAVRAVLCFLTSSRDLAGTRENASKSFRGPLRGSVEVVPLDTSYRVEYGQRGAHPTALLLASLPIPEG